jgi:hypothetical protein
MFDKIFDQIGEIVKPAVTQLGLEALKAKPDLALTIFPSLKDYFNKIEKLDIDKAKSEIVISAMLHGEASPIDLRLHYEIMNEEEENILRIHGGESSREWITALIKNLAPRQRIIIPKEFKAIAAALK